jgi:hypothetical protein
VGKGLSVEPRGLKPGNNILILFPKKKPCAYYVILSSWQREKRVKGRHADGTHAVPRVTSVHPDACK